MKKIMCFISIVFVSLEVFGFMNKEGLGTTSGQFLKLGAGAKASSMGEAFTGISDDATAIYWNPSGINRLNRKEMSLMYAVFFENISYNNLFYIHPTDIGNLGLGLQYLSYGSVEGLDEYGNPTENFTPTDLAITLSYARAIQGIDIGISLKYISSKIKETATTIAFDIGLMKQLIEDKLSIGLVITNLGGSLKYISESSSLPMNIKIGCGYKIKKDIITSFDIVLPSDNEIIVAVGGEYNYRIKDGFIVSGRLGYNTITKDIDGLKGITLGLGANYKNYKLDYAFVPYGDLGNTHKISLGLKF